MSGYLYILSNRKNGTLYIGATADIEKKIWEHQQKVVSGFSDKYNLTNLVYYETFDNVLLARARERTLKKWNRSWKIALIEKMNPGWRDLYRDII